MPRGTTPFVRKTWDMLADKSLESIVCWTRNGNCFGILDTTAFSADVLPKFFKHGNLGSFIRQLNTYGFKKVTSRDSQEYEFSHKLFHRDHEELLPHIVRRTSSKVSDEEASPTQQNDLLRQLVDNNKELIRRLKKLEEQHRQADTELHGVRKELVETKEYAQRLTATLQWKGNQQLPYFPPRHTPPTRSPAARVYELPLTPSSMITSQPEELKVWSESGGLPSGEFGTGQSTQPPTSEFDMSFPLDLPDSFWNAL